MREQHGRGLQGKQKIRYSAFVWGLVAHALSARGSLGHHMRTVSGVDISNSTVQQRREGLQWEWFEALFSHILQPLAQHREKEHLESFHHGLRLLAVDGSWWSLRNTLANLEASPAGSRSQCAKRAAFVKWGTAVLLEIGTHQPLAAACARMDLEREEGEMNITRRVLGGIPQREGTLLLADRLYGCGRFILDAKKAAPNCEVLMRVSSLRKPKIVALLEDGSAIVEVNVKRPGSTRIERTLRLRLVSGQVWRAQGLGEDEAAKRTEVCLWTTLCDEHKHPGIELLALYAKRWEQELFFRELKRHTGRENLLRAGTVAGAQAEFGAMIIAASLLAAQRVKAARQVGLAPTRLSITKIGRAMEALLPVLSVAGDLLKPGQVEKIIARFMEHTAREARIPPRRSRSCQRGLRKTVCSWPRIRSRQILDGACLYALTPVPFP